MSNFVRKTRAEWSEFSDELLDDSDDSTATACRWRNGNTIGKASVSVGRRSRLNNLGENKFSYKQNELAHDQYRGSVYNDVSPTAPNRLAHKRQAHLNKPSDCLNVSDSDMSLAIMHGSSMGTYRTVPNHRGNSYNMSAQRFQARSSSLYGRHRVHQKTGFETPYNEKVHPDYHRFRDTNESKDLSNEITEKFIEAVKTKCLSPAKIKLLQKVLDSTTERSLGSKKGRSKMMRSARASTLKRRINKFYQSKRKSSDASSDSSDLSSAETDCRDNMINTMRPLRDDNNVRYNTRMTEFKLPSTRLDKKLEQRTMPLSTYDLRSDALSHVTTESHKRSVPVRSNYSSINENSFLPNHRSTMLNIDCTSQSSMTNMSMRPSFMRRKLFTQSDEYVADADENSFNGGCGVPNIYAEEGLLKRPLRRSVCPWYSRSRRISNTDNFQTRRQTINVRQANTMTPVLKKLMEKCNTGLRNNYLPHIRGTNTVALHVESADMARVRTPIDRPAGQPLRKKFIMTSESDDNLNDVASDLNNEVKTSKDRLMELDPEPRIDNVSPRKVFANQKENTKKPDVIIPCYVHIRKGDIIRHSDILKMTSLDSENVIENNNTQASHLLSSALDTEPAKDVIGIDKNISVSKYHKSPSKPKAQSKNFGNSDSNLAPISVDASESDEPLTKLKKLSLAKQGNSSKNATKSTETPDDDIIRKVQSNKSVSRKTPTLNNSTKQQNDSTESGYFLRRKTAVNTSDLNNALADGGRKIDTLKQRVTQNSLHREDQGSTKKQFIKTNKNSNEDKARKRNEVQENQGCIIEKVKTVQKIRKPRHKRSEANQETSSSFQVSGQSDSGACQDTKRLNESSSKASGHDNNSKSSTKKANQSSKFWNLSSSSSSEKEELNKERNHLSNKQNTHNVPDLESSGGGASVKEVRPAAEDVTVKTVGIKSKTKPVASQACSNIKEFQGTSTCPTRQPEREPIAPTKRSRILPSFYNKIFSERVVTRSKSVGGANFLVPSSTMDFARANHKDYKCSSVIEMNVKPHSGTRYGQPHGESKLFNEDDGCCSVTSFNSVPSRRRRAKFAHFF